MPATEVAGFQFQDDRIIDMRQFPLLVDRHIHTAYCVVEH